MHTTELQSDVCAILHAAEASHHSQAATDHVQVVGRRQGGVGRRADGREDVPLETRGRGWLRNCALLVLRLGRRRLLRQRRKRVAAARRDAQRH